MIGALGMGIVLLIAVYFILRWFVDANPAEIVKALKIIGIGAIIAVAAFFLVTGKVAYALMALPVLLPWILRIRRAATTAKNFSRAWSGMSGAGTGQSSRVTARYLDMTLNHDTGELDGQIREGRHAGAWLDDLGTPDLISLLSEFMQQDSESAQLLEAYLDRNRDGWREDAENAGAEFGGSGQASANAGPMTRDEAFAILGLAPDADEVTIREAYRRLISTMHPDHGGSDYLAAKINQAKDVLLDT